MKKVFLVISILLLLFFAFAVWYKYEYSMYVVNERTIKNPEFEEKLLVVTQGSAFKDSITRGIVDHYQSDSVFIRIIDVSQLPEINLKDYDAMVLMHTWENWKPPMPVEDFINGLEDERDKIIVLTTSGNGGYKMENVDAITGESDLERAPEFTNKILVRLNPLFRDK